LRVARASETAVAVGVIQTTCVSLLSDCSLSVGHWSVGLRVAGRITEIYVDSALVSGPLSRGLGFPDFSQVGLKKSVEIWSLRPLMPALQPPSLQQFAAIWNDLESQGTERVDLELLLEPVLLEGPRKRADQVVGGG